MVVLGIDPGSSRIGYGLIEKKGRELSYIASGLLAVPKADQAKKLGTIEQELRKLIRENCPSRIALEKLFFFKNKKTFIEVAEARGAILATIEKTGIPFVEFTPLQVKQAVTGNGTASKEAVAKMVRHFLKLPLGKMVDDASDALAIAIAASTTREEDYVK
jgi:crossover junction endodeoxyribonuclease RuvC